MSVNKSHLIGCSLLVMLFSAPLLLNRTYKLSAASVELPASIAAEAIDSELLVLFAGFIGCTDYCQTALSGLSEVMDSVPQGSLSVVFLNIVRGTPNTVTSAYASSIDDRFHGYSMPASEQAELEWYRKFGIRSGATAESVRSHAQRVFLFRKKEPQGWILVRSDAEFPGVQGYAQTLNAML